MNITAAYFLMGLACSFIFTVSMAWKIAKRHSDFFYVKEEIKEQAPIIVLFAIFNLLGWPLVLIGGIVLGLLYLFGYLFHDKI